VSSFGTLLEIARDGGGALTLLLLFKTSPGTNVRNLAATEISLREAVTAFGLLYMGGFLFFGGVEVEDISEMKGFEMTLRLGKIPRSNVQWQLMV
jgi:hypothetical protein